MNIRNGMIISVLAAAVFVQAESANILAVITPAATDKPTHLSVTVDGRSFHISATNVRDLSLCPAEKCTDDIRVFLKGDAVPVERLVYFGRLDGDTLMLYDFGMRSRVVPSGGTNTSMTDVRTALPATNYAAPSVHADTNGEGRMTIAGRITDGTEKASSATVSIYRMDGETLTAVVKDKEVNGAFSIDVPSEGEYSIVARGTNGMAAQDIPLASKGLAPDIAVRAPQAGESMTLRTILFDTDKWDIRAESLPILNDIAAFLAGQRSVTIEIAGHTDDRAAAEYNQRLSVKRAESIKQYLVSKGIARERVAVKGYGASKPVADNATARGKYLNRRVEFLIVTR